MEEEGKIMTIQICQVKTRYENTEGGGARGGGGSGGGRPRPDLFSFCSF